jgi:nitrate reductase beta subunit
LLYDADQMLDALSAPNDKLVEAQREMILDPFDEKVQEGALRNGIDEKAIEAAQLSPVYRYVKEWNLALPLHAEFRTMPMLFYVPPLLPVMAKSEEGLYDSSGKELFAPIDKARLPMEYMAKLFSAGNVEQVRYALRKQYAVRLFKRMETVGDIDHAMVRRALEQVEATEQEAEAIYRLTSLPTMDERFVIPPSHREEAMQMLNDDMWSERGEAGFGFRDAPVRGA